MTVHIDPSAVLEPALLDQLWDFNDPATSERRFRDALSTSASIAAAELTTQIARALGLQGKFDEARDLLDAITPRGAIVMARICLERGRLANSSGKPRAALTWFAQAWEHATVAGNEYLAVDALHMLAIADPDGAAEWTQRGLDIASRSIDPRTRRWLGSLHNNLGWTFHDRGDYAAALAQFELALEAFEAIGTPGQVHVAHWTIARCLRSLGRYHEALEIQQRLASQDPFDEFVAEEIATLNQAISPFGGQSTD